MNKKMIVGIVVIVILVVAGIMVFNRGDKEDAKSPENNTSEEQKSDQEQVKGNVLEGTLKVSNDSTRGNLMLELLNSDRVIYLRTSRDFSSLVGKDVAVTIDGTMEKFSLIDIQLMTKDGSVKMN